MRSLILKGVSCGLIAAMLCLGSMTTEASAAGNGRGQMLRDGSHANNWQGTAPQRDCASTGSCNYNTGTRGGYGDGTHPRPMDGTGFGKRR